MLSTDWTQPTPKVKKSSVFLLLICSFLIQLMLCVGLRRFNPIPKAVMMNATAASEKWFMCPPCTCFLIVLRQGPRGLWWISVRPLMKWLEISAGLWHPSRVTVVLHFYKEISQTVSFWGDHQLNQTGWRFHLFHMTKSLMQFNRPNLKHLLHSALITNVFVVDLFYKFTPKLSPLEIMSSIFSMKIYNLHLKVRKTTTCGWRVSKFVKFLFPIKIFTAVQGA